MTLCSLIFRQKSSPNVCLIPKDLRKAIVSALKVKKTYAANLSGVGLVGFDIEVEEEEALHVMNFIRVIEKNHNLALLEFSEKKRTKNQNTVSVKVDKSPITNIK